MDWIGFKLAVLLVIGLMTSIDSFGQNSGMSFECGSILSHEEEEAHKKEMDDLRQNGIFDLFRSEVKRVP